VVGNNAEEFFGQSFGKAKEVIDQVVSDVKEGATNALSFFGIDFRTPAPAKPPVEAVKAPTIDSIFPQLIQAESGGIHADEKGVLTRSGRGAEGITQLMPSTAKKPGYGIEPAKDRSETEYLRVGKQYLQKMYDKFGDWEKALAAYNAGVGNVMKAEGKAERFGGDWKEHLNDAQKKETIPYINKVMRKTDKPSGTATTGSRG
jgi:hypothetical protein